MCKMLDTLVASRSFRRRAEMPEIDLMAVLFLAEHGPSLVGDVRKAISTLPAAMSRTIRTLEEGGLTKSEMNGLGDRRSYLLSLTPKGEKLVSQLKSEME